MLASDRFVKGFLPGQCRLNPRPLAFCKNRYRVRKNILYIAFDPDSDCDSDPGTESYAF
jgi:hypothetical protein